MISFPSFIKEGRGLPAVAELYEAKAGVVMWKTG